jgi:di/tricarboxylate transporter
VAGAVLRIGDLLGPTGVLAALFLLAAVLSTTVNSGAAVILLCPVAAVAAAASGLPEVRFFLAVAFGASCVFLWPYGNQAGLLVMGPGGYTQRDFLRAGLGLSILYAVSSVALISVL